MIENTEAKTELETVKAELETVKAELETVKVDIAKAQSELATSEGILDAVNEKVVAAKELHNNNVFSQLYQVDFFAQVEKLLAT